MPKATKLSEVDQSYLDRICAEQDIDPALALSSGDKSLAPSQLRLMNGRADLYNPSVLHSSEVTFYPSIFCMLSLPTRSQPGKSEYVRDSGNGYRLSIFTPARVGIPYGIYPRGILSFIAEEITVNKHKGKTDPQIIELGDTVSDFIMDLTPANSVSGGKRGNLTILRKQLRSLVRSKIEFSHYDQHTDLDDSFTNYRFVHKGKEVHQPHLWQPEVSEKTGKLIIRVDDDFYWDVVEHASPFYKSALRALWPSCLRVDIANWVAYRGNELQGGTLHLSWRSLQAQFGLPYKGDGSERVFKQRFKEAFDVVRALYDPGDPDCIRLDEVGSRVQLTAKRPMVPALDGKAMDQLVIEHDLRRSRKRGLNESDAYGHMLKLFA